jgi:hypothetical protein
MKSSMWNRAPTQPRHGPAEHARGRKKRRGLVGGIILWVALPAGSVLMIGAIGTALDPQIALYATPLLFVLLLIGLPMMAARVVRWVSGDQIRLGGRSWRTRIGRIGPPPPYILPIERPTLPTGKRLAAAGLVALMFVLAFAMWTIAPFGCIWLASQLAETTQPAMGTYLVIICSIATSMFAFGKALVTVNRIYLHLYGAEIAARRRASWLKSLRDARPIANRSTLEIVLMSSVLTALICVTVWFFFFAEMRSMLEQYTD